MTRYFMSVEEAVQLVLQAAVLADRGDVYMLEMGEPLSILELAHRMIRLSGLHPGTDIRIRITGPRVGEKIHEHLHNEDEHLAPTRHPSILRLERSPQEDSTHLNDGLTELLSTTRDRNEVRARRALFELVAEESTTAAVDGGAVGDTLEVDKATEHGSPAPFVEDEIPA